jgi:preprotein translocase subunit SecA
MPQQLHPRLLEEVNNEVNRLSKLTDARFAEAIHNAFDKVAAGESLENSLVNILAVVAVQVVGVSSTQDQAFTASIVYGGLLSALIVHYWHKPTHEAPNATQ